MTLAAMGNSTINHAQTRFGRWESRDYPPKDKGEQHIVEDDYGNRTITTNLGDGLYGVYTITTNPPVPADASISSDNGLARALIVEGLEKG